MFLSSQSIERKLRAAQLVPGVSSLFDLKPLLPSGKQHTLPLPQRRNAWRQATCPRLSAALCWGHKSEPALLIAWVLTLLTTLLAADGLIVWFNEKAWPSATQSPFPLAELDFEIVPGTPLIWIPACHHSLPAPAPHLCDFYLLWTFFGGQHLITHRGRVTHHSFLGGPPPTLICHH